MSLVRRLICGASLTYTLVLVGYIIATWFPVDETSSFAAVTNFITKATEPLLNPIKRVMPAATVGAVSVDFSVLILFMVFGFLVPTIAGCYALY